MSVGFNRAIVGIRRAFASMKGAPALSFASNSLRQRLGALLLIFAALIPTAASAQSSGCAAVNANKLNLSGVFTSGNLGSTTGARFSTSVSDQAINALNISATSDPAAGTAAYDGSTYTFAAGDVITYSVTVSGYSGSGSLVFNVRNGDSATTVTNPTSDTFTGDATRTYTYPVVGGETSIGVRIGKSATPSGTITVGATCVGAPTAPTVTALSPNAGPTAGGNTVVITGTGFSGATDVSFGATPATGFTVNSATQITATAPAGSAGTTNVTVTTGGGTSATGAGNQYTYVAAPTITSVAPTSGPTAGGTTVVLTGTNFAGTTAVTFGATAATSFTVNSNTQITATAPAGSGTVNVRATTTGGTSATAAANQFTYVSAPTITSVSPTAGPTSGGTTVVLTGTNLTGTTAVNFGATAATGFTVDSATQITATAPAGSGTVNVRATTAGGTSATAAGNQYTYVAAPTVTALSPTAGTTAGGTTVVITGTNFTGATAVLFGGTSATSYTVNSATQITAVAPAGAGTVNVRVTTLGGTSATGAGNVYAYSTPPAAPVVQVPANGATVGTTTPSYQGVSDASVTITVYVDGASIGTTTASGAGTWSLTQPTALSSGSHTVRATATNAQGLVSTSSATNTFSVTPAPVASSFTFGSIVAYNDGGNLTTSFNLSGQVTGSPTSYAVGSATTANGGSVSIDNSGQVTYTAPVGFRGANDSFTYTATNAGGTSAPGTVTLTIGNPTLTASLSGSGTRGSPLSGVQIVPAGGAAPYSCGTTPASGALPSGTQINADCTVTGTPAASGTFNFTANVTDSSTGAGPFTQASGTLTLVVSAPTLSLSPAAGALPGATAGAAYSQTFTAAGGTAPYSYARTAGTLPPGVTLTGGTLSGTPTAVGTYNFTITAADSSSAGSGGPYTVANSYSVTVAAPTIALSPATLPNGTIGAAYTTSVSASGGTGAYSYAVTAGTLPTGVTLASNGTFSGTPTAGGTFNFTVTASDSTPGPGAPYTGSRAYAITIGAPTITLAPATLTNAAIGSAYSATITASGGTGGYVYAVTAGALPAGITLATSGTISGTPTAGGTFNFTVTATDSSTGAGPYTGARAYTLTVGAPTITIAPATLPSATAGAAYSQSLSASGGTAPYTFAITAGALPAGLTLASDGTLSGTPTAGGTFNFTVRATDSSTGAGPFTGTRAYSLTVTAALIVVGPATLPNGTAGTPYSQTLTASGGNGSYSFAVTAGALPPGWTLSSAGVLSGTATASNAFNFTITATDQSTGAGAPYSGSRAYSVNVGSPNFTLTAPTSPASVGQAYTGNFVAGGGTAPYTYSRITASGPLPPGLSLASDGTLSGTPTAAGTFNFSVVARDSTTGAGAPYGVAGNFNFTVSAPSVTIAPTSLASGSVGTTYGATISASGGTAPYSYAVTAGALPAGLSLDASSGVLSGTPTAGGTFNFTVTATDSSAGTQFTASRAYALTIAPATITLTPTTLPSGTPGAAYSQTLGGAGGTAPYSFGVTSGALPAGLSLASNGALTGTPTAAGTFNFTVQATDSSTGAGAPYSGTQAYTLTVGSPTITVDTTTLPNATVAATYSQTLSASGGTGPYSYAVSSGTLPAGVTLSSAGVLSGTATQGGSFTFTVTATDSSGGSGPFTGSRPLTLVVNAPTIALSPASLTGATVGSAYSQAITATGGTGSYSYAVTAGALPAGMTLAADGTLAGTPTASGSFNFTVTATDSSTGTGAPYSGSRAYTLTVSAPALSLAPATLPNATVSASYTATISAAGGTAPYSYAVTAGALPGGVTLASNGTLSGSPTAGGTFNFTITATDSSTGAGAPFSVSRAYSLTVGAPTLSLAPATLPAGQMEVAYSQALSATGGTAPYSYAVTAGALPAGLTLTGSTIAGTPSVNGTFNFTVSVTDSSSGSGPFTAARAYTLTIAAPAAPVAGSVSATVAYESVNNTIPPALSGGTATSVAVATAPAHGTASASGTTLTYTPAAGYYGADSFTYTATNAGGTSAPATVNITVTVPAAPTAADLNGVAVAYNSPGTAIDLSGSITGVRSSVAVAAGPAHGTVSVSGEVVTYTPSAGYYGGDSFTYTATGPGGTSAPATVSLTVATPAAPTAADVSGVNVAYNSTGTAIDLSGSISGVRSSIAVASAPSHGTVSVSGEVVTYTPTAGYYGGDSFTYTATGPGGTSAPATVSLTVATPAAPTAADVSGVNVAYNSTGTAIDLSGSISGVRSSIAVASAPSHGTVSVSGEVVTYTPTAGYYGGDSFTYTATGPGGTSAAATVSLTVATPAAPVASNRTGVNVGYDSTGTAIDLGSSITGVYASVAVAAAPAHGTASVSGSVVTYTPTTGYYGADSFTYTAAGPGGTSNVATVSLTVANPPAPQTEPGQGSTSGSSTSTGAPVEIDLSALVQGEYTAIQIQTPPVNGRVTVRTTGQIAQSGISTRDGPQTIATYTPNQGFAGADTFTFVAVGPGGTSTPSAVTITVVGSVPVAQPKTASAGDGETVSVDLTADAAQGPFNAATIVGITPANAATAAIVASGTGAARTYRLDVTPTARFSGNVVVTYTLTNAYGVSAPSTVTVTVTARPSPTEDPNIRAISDAQAETARRFARSQVSNFMRRTEQLHGNGGGTGGAMGVTLTSRDGGTMVRSSPAFDASALEITERMRRSGEDPALGRLASNREASRWNRPDKLGTMGAISDSASTRSGSASGATAAAPANQADVDETGDGTRKIGSIGIWSGGAIDIGTRDQTTDRSKITATTSGLSGGADIKLADGVVVGIGGGYGNDLTRIDGGAARVRGESSMVAAYASVSPLESAFIDAMIGRGDLSFRSRRTVAGANAVAEGRRDGSFTVGALALGIDRRGDALNWSLYGRGELLDADLGAYAETGAGRYNLRFDDRNVRSVTGVLGARIEYRQVFDFGTVTPRLRGEFSHEFADIDAQRLDYADIAGPSIYSLGTNGWSRDQYQIAIGARFALPQLWSFDFETGFRGASGERAATLRIQVSKEF